MAYTTALLVHSILRWVTLALGVVLFARSMAGWRGDRAFSASDNKLGLAFVSAVDIQWLVGVALYAFLSPITQLFFASRGAAMKDPVLRFYGVEHLTIMMLAFILAHVARARSKRLEGSARHRVIAISTLVWLVLVVAGIPWPGRAAGRPLL